MKKLTLIAALAAMMIVPSTASAAYLHMEQAERIAQREAKDFANIGEDYGVNGCVRQHGKRIDCEIYSYDEIDGQMTCTATVTIIARGNYAYWSNWRGINCESTYDGS